MIFHQLQQQNMHPVLRLAIFAALGFYASWSIAVATAIILNVVVFHRKLAWLFVRTFPRDMAALLQYGKFIYHLRKWQKRNETAVTLFDRIAMEIPNKTMFIFGDRKLTFAEAAKFTRKVAALFASRGFIAGDNVALMMSNSPEMILIWLGLARIGVASALVNTNLRKAPLLHSISAINAKAVIFSPDMFPALTYVSDKIRDGKILFLCYGEYALNPVDGFPTEPLHDLIAKSDDCAPTYRANVEDCLVYVFTSGTTGLPKAAIIRHYRFALIAATGRYLIKVTSDDVLYSYLPFYHTVGGLLGLSQTIVFGTTAVIAPKFSASGFWRDCIKYNCTVTQYIGEVCRYLLNQPDSDYDQKHSIRMMFGNGIRPTIWSTFVNRFAIKELKEFYASTEGNGALINLDGSNGNVGFYPTICRLSSFLNSLLWNRYFIKVDPETGEPLRNKDGLCIQCGPNEPGEFVALINNSKPETAYDGYIDESATFKKIYSDVARIGDRCFATGDILVYDDDGYIRFKDRTGDTFRWKGENVSTTEVENIVAKYATNRPCIVFGVEIPNHEGKAGMAVLLDDNDKHSLDVNAINEIFDDVRSELPSYAVPMFIRVTNHLEETSTYKLPKTKFISEGYDIRRHQDPLYILDSLSTKYVAFDEVKYNQLLQQFS